MEKREVGRKSNRTVPVIIENHENAAKKIKLMVPSHYTAGHLVNILRSRMQLLPYHSVYLFIKSKQSPVLMSKSIGHLHLKHRDEKGLLRLVHAGQGLFGFRGNIRAIRFRQKWLENLHNTLHQDAGGLLSYSGAPPPYFPLEPPSTTNFGAPLDVDALADMIIPNIDDDYYDYMANSLLFDIESPPLPPSTMPDANLPTPLASHSQNPMLIDSVSSAFNDWPSSSSLSDPWLPSASTSSTQTPGSGGTFVLLNSEEEINQFNVEVEQISQSIYNGVPHSSIPHVTVNIQPAIIPNPQFPPQGTFTIPSSNAPPILYESDSDFYDSDKDADMDE